MTTPATPRSLATVRAVKARHQWGFFAARRYAERQGATPLMWMIAFNLECERNMRRINRDLRAYIQTNSQRGKAWKLL